MAQLVITYDLLLSNVLGLGVNQILALIDKGYNNIDDCHNWDVDDATR